MPTTMTTTDSVPIIFRAERSGDFKGDVTAVFPTIAGDYEGRMSCYMHVGQHSACSFAWYRTTRPATSEEYVPLLRELRAIYEVDDGLTGAVRLDVRAKIMPWMHAERRKGS